MRIICKRLNLKNDLNLGMPNNHWKVKRSKPKQVRFPDPLGLKAKQDRGPKIIVKPPSNPTR